MSQIPPYTPPTTPQKPKKKIDPIRSVLFVVAMGIAIWFFFADIAPAPQINNFQASMFGGSYYPKLTLILLIFVFALPMIAIQKLIQLLMNKK